MSIHDVKNDPIHQDSSPWCNSIHARELKFGTLKSHIMTIHDVKNDRILQVSSQEPSSSSKYDFNRVLNSGNLSKIKKILPAEHGHRGQGILYFVGYG